MAETNKQQAKRREQEFKARVGDYLKTFGTAHGIRIIKDMRKSYCGHVFNENPITLAYNVGKMEVVKDIEALLVTGKNPKLIEALFSGPEDEGFEL